MSAKPDRIERRRLERWQSAVTKRLGEESPARHETALALRASGATYRTIGVALGVGAQRAREIVGNAEREAGWRRAMERHAANWVGEG